MVTMDNVIVEQPLPDEVVDPRAWFRRENLARTENEAVWRAGDDAVLDRSLFERDSITLSGVDRPDVPLEVEIGSGKGGFLLSRARANPDICFLGIEWANKYFRYSADRMARWNLTNVRIMRADAKVFFTRNLGPACISVLHLYHPDPWPKKRHHKRRLVQPDFVEAVARCMMTGGCWLIQSDHGDYFGWIRRMIGSCRAFLEIAPIEAGAKPGADWRGTNFEVKYAREGRTIYRTAYRKTD